MKQKPQGFSTPFRDYFKKLSAIDKGKRDSDEFGSILILTLVEEIGEMAAKRLTWPLKQTKRMNKNWVIFSCRYCDSLESKR
jgi:hypothetical protein